MYHARLEPKVIWDPEAQDQISVPKGKEPGRQFESDALSWSALRYEHFHE